jgi:RNase P protein component
MRTRSPLFDALKFDFADEFKSRPIVDSDKPSTQFAAICNSGPAGPRDMKPLQTRAGTRWLNGIPENDSAPGSGQPDCELTKSDFRAADVPAFVIQRPVHPSAGRAGMPTDTGPFGVRAHRNTVGGAKRLTLCVSRSIVSTLRRQTRSALRNFSMRLPRTDHREIFTYRSYDRSHMKRRTRDAFAPEPARAAMHELVVQQRPSCLTTAEFAPTSIDGINPPYSPVRLNVL